MDFTVTIKQLGGIRDYLICTVEIPDDAGRPLSEAECTSVAHQAIPRMAEQLRRCSGLSYMTTFIGEGSTGLELGVDCGDGVARALLRNPECVVAVDHWRAWKTDGFASDSQEIMDQRYDWVKKRFIGDPRVEVVRSTVQGWLSECPSASFDWVFVDANHRFPACRDDMLGAFRVLRPGGMLFIDDAFSVEWREQVQRGISGLLEVHSSGLERIWGDSDPVIYRKRPSSV